MKLKWERVIWLEDYETPVRDNSLISFARINGFSSDEISAGLPSLKRKLVDGIVDEDSQRVWIINDFEGPFEFSPIRELTREEKKKIALNRLSAEEKEILGL